MAELEKTLVGGDVLQHEGNAGVTRESKTVANASGSAIVLPAGFPLDDNVLCVQATIANCDGITLVATDIPDGESRKITVLARGPAAVNADALATVDMADAAFNAATYKSTVQALGIVVREESDTVEIQTT